MLPRGKQNVGNAVAVSSLHFMPNYKKNGGWVVHLFLVGGGGGGAGVVCT